MLYTDVVIEGYVNSMLPTIMEETGGLGVDIVIDNGGKTLECIEINSGPCITVTLNIHNIPFHL